MPNLRGSVTLVAAAFTALLPIALVGLPAHAQTTDVPVPLKQSVDCMFEVLKTVPGVSEPKLGYVTSEGWAHPFLEYRSAEGNDVHRMRFEAQKGDKYWFLAMMSGRIDPRIGDIDIHVTHAVMQKWKTQCNVEANVLFL
jgi:hypothetical protein